MRLAHLGPRGGSSDAKHIIHDDVGISTETVKQHTINLYQKLHVNNRRQGTIRARALGILPD